MENFEGEKAYVANLGHLREDDGAFYLTGGNPGQDSLLEVFQDLGINTGNVLVEYDNEEDWVITNYLGEGNVVNTDCDDCEEFVIPSGNENAADISFSLDKGGKKLGAGQGTSIGEFTDEYYQYSPGDQAFVIVAVNGNDYRFNRPSSGEKVEGLLFRNIGENYVKVVPV